MNRTTIQIDEIVIENRLRIDHSNTDHLKESLKERGTIQPVVLEEQEDGTLRLIAGGRRLMFLKELGHITLYHGSVYDPEKPGFVYGKEIPDDVLHELELEENLKRREMAWQERCIAIKVIHNLKQKRAALEGSTWGQRETADMLGIKGVSNINYALKVAELIQDGDVEIINSENLSDALRKTLIRKQNELEAELRYRTPSIQIGLPTDLASFAQPVIEPVTSLFPSEKEQVHEKYLSNPLNNPADFDSYYSSLLSLRSEKEQHRNTIHLSKMLYCCDSIELMNHPDCKERFDAIITDIPYGIDMDMLNQGNDGHAFQDIETVLSEHTVEGNVELFKRFFPAAFHCLKNNTYLITFCDQMQWQLMYDLATQAGFKVQRWPITWVKTSSCMNQCANTNFTKTTEIAIVCRKGTATLTRANIPTHVLAGHDDMKDTLGHPFTKPFLLWSHLIDAVTLEGQHVLEPFVGRGSGLLSLLRKKRHVTACEINVEHFNALIENTKQYFLNQNPNIQFA